MNIDNLMDLIKHRSVPEPPPFAIIYRPGTADDSALIDVLIGDIVTSPRLSDLEIIADPAGELPSCDALLLLPYRQIGERGIECIDDGTPLQALHVKERRVVTKSELRQVLPDDVLEVTRLGFDLDNGDYAELVRKIISDEIGRGEGANFVLKRSFFAQISDYTVRKALTIFGRLLDIERGAHWISCVYTGSRTLIGASPERHLTIAKDIVTMNPISGTYRYPPDGPAGQKLLEFLADQKESDELNMVLDEELKAMARVCVSGGVISGPYLRPMARLAHTEYFITGRTVLSAKQILARTMFAPTVTGSPLANACRIIAKYEPIGRAYYAGVIALVGRDVGGQQWLDSVINIRTADIDDAGLVRIDVGATLVRHSQPESEALETEAKAAALLAALGLVEEESRSHDESSSTILEISGSRVHSLLAARNRSLSRYWLSRTAAPKELRQEKMKQILVIDYADDFSHMLAHQLRWLGLRVEVRRYDELMIGGEYDAIVLGPGPGSPLDKNDSKISSLRSLCRSLLRSGEPLLAVCLGHQIAAAELGFELRHLERPNQGTQRVIDYFSTREVCGFYNSYSAYAESDRVISMLRGDLQVSRDARSGEVHAIRGRKLWTLQFHAESVLTRNGAYMIGEIMKFLID